jgi:hypothetical protein
MIKKTYHWKEITEDGLVKEPKEFGPYYSTESLNGWGGHESIEDAYEKLEQINKSYPYSLPELTLVTTYSVDSDT